MDDLLDEHEQCERVLAWLRRNGAGLIGGVIIGLALILGWQWWGSRQASAEMQAGNASPAMIDSLEAQDLHKSQSHAAALGRRTTTPWRCWLWPKARKASCEDIACPFGFVSV